MAKKNHRTFFVIGFVVVMVSGLFVCRFNPMDEDNSKEPTNTGQKNQMDIQPVHVLEQHGFHFELTQKGLPVHGQWRGCPDVGDFNRDGNLDLVCSNRKGDGLHVFLGDGKGGFTDHSKGFDHLLGYGGASVGDFNNDEIPDILFSTHRVPMVAYAYDGKSTWADLSEGFNNKEIFHDVASADFDGDGNLDVAGLGLFGGGIVLFSGNGKGKWARAPFNPVEERKFGREIIAADIDEDGTPDIIATHIGIKALLNQGGFKFKDISRGLPVPRTLGTYSGVAAANVDGRKGMEIATASIAIEGNRGLAVYTRSDDGLWKLMSNGLPEGKSCSAVTFADFNCDGKMDLAAGSEDTGINIYLGDGTGSWSHAGTIPKTKLHKITFTTGDFNNDNRTDLIVVYPDSPGGVICFLNRAFNP